MSRQKKIDSKDISEKFGVKISEKDLIPKTRTEQHGMKQFANLGAILKENNFKVRDEKEKDSDTVKEKKADTKRKNDGVVDTSGETFSDIYSRLESASAIKCGRKPEHTDKGKNFNSKSSWDKAGKAIRSEETDEFAKYLSSFCKDIPNKDSEESDK